MENLYFSADLGVFSASNENYRLHCHNEYEIYMFLEGDSKYVVEEKNYNLAPNDVIIIRKHQMHRIFHNSNKTYRRFTLTISPEFFLKNACTEYEAAFLEENFNTGNKISADVVRSSGLYDALMRFKKYSLNYTILNSPIVHSSVIEIIYLINKISSFENPNKTESPLKNIINYINNHFTDEITLDWLCEQFFISKYHLCRLFKKNTGLTVQMYIKQKRLILVDELRKEGKSLTEAASRAGFNDYSSFYRTYIKKHGSNPSNMSQNRTFNLS